MCSRISDHRRSSVEDAVRPPRQSGGSLSGATAGDLGFTLIELMVVVLVIAILLAIAIPTFLGARSRSQDAVATTSLHTALQAASAADFSGTDAAGMSSQERSLTYAAGASTGPKQLSVAQNGTVWSAAARSDDGICYMIRAVSGQAPTYGKTTGTCTADAAAALATGSSYTSGSASRYSAAVLSLSSLVAYWPMNDTSTATLYDSGPGHNNGTVSQTITVGQPSALVGDPGTSVTFTGGWAALPTLNPSWSSGITMVAWVKPAAHNFYGRILELGNGKGLDNISFGQYAGTNQLAFEVRPAGSAVLRVLAPAGTFSVGTWNQVAVTEAPGGLTTFYVNGAAVASSTYARFPANTSRAVNFLARSAWTGEPAYRGTLDDVAIWNRALSDTEIAGLNSAGS